MARLVIAGASLAGARAAQAAREGGWDGPIVVVGEEPHMPYSRPPLSKQLLTGCEQLGDHFLPAPADVTWLLGERAVGLDRTRRRLVLAAGEQLAYDRLVIATGCRPRRWTGPGAELAGLHAIRSAEDALALRRELASASRAAIVGAGFIGCEVAASARALGVEVVLFDVAPVPMLALGDRLGKRCAALHRAHGVELRLSSAIVALHGEDGRFRAVELSGGERVEADLAVIALGALPCTDWLEGSGLALEPGVRCDATLTTEGDPDVLAAGDVAAWPHALTHYQPLRVEHWTNAAEQGVLAGRNAVLPAAEREPYSAVPSLWSDQYDVKIQAVGLPRLAEELRVVEESADGERLVAVGIRDGLLVAAVAFNGARRLPAYRRRVGAPLSFDALAAELAEDPKSLGRPATTELGPTNNSRPVRTP